jgi:hypothetical protein
MSLKEEQVHAKEMKVQASLARKEEELTQLADKQNAALKQKDQELHGALPSLAANIP